MFGFPEQRSFLRCEFLYPASEDPLDTVQGHHEGLVRGGLEYVYFKGNDSLLHYTLVDWSSGSRRMIDLYHQARALWHKRKHPGEWLYAAYRADFGLEGVLASQDGQDPAESSDRLELTEIGVRLAYNGRAFLGKETLSIVASCNATGILTGNAPEAHGHNLGLLMGSLHRAWCATGPLFGWIGVGTRPDVDIPPLVGANRVPRNAWFTLYPPDLSDEMRARCRASAGKIQAVEVGDGSVMLENVRNRPMGLAQGLEGRLGRSNP